MLDKLEAPWTPNQVAALNEYQRDGKFHPFTCVNRNNDAHRAYAETHALPDHGILVARRDGWFCPVCDYRQGWTHPFMAAPNTPDQRPLENP